jgi:endonuclease/exonuclease/phosphatase family metal-dependent hydrolase
VSRRRRERYRTLRSARPITVLSYNIQGYGSLVSRRYLDGIARVIEEVHPDVVGLQEVHRGTWPARFEDQVEELARRTGLEPWFGSTVSLGTGAHGNAVLVRGRVLGGEVVGLPGRMERRSLLACHVELERGLRFDFFVTHLAAWGRFARMARHGQAQLISGRLARSRSPYVLVGDFNAPPEAPELGPVLGGSSARLCGVRDEPTHRVMRRRIDYICACPSWHEVESRVLRTGPSDHFPVTAKLKLRRDADLSRQVVDPVAQERAPLQSAG